MDRIIIELGNAIRPAVLNGDSFDTRPKLTKALYLALHSAANVIERRYGGPIIPRYRGCELDNNRQ